MTSSASAALQRTERGGSSNNVAGCAKRRGASFECPASPARLALSAALFRQSVVEGRQVTLEAEKLTVTMEDEASQTPSLTNPRGISRRARRWPIETPMRTSVALRRALVELWRICRLGHDDRRARTSSSGRHWLGQSEFACGVRRLERVSDRCVYCVLLRGTSTSTRRRRRSVLSMPAETLAEPDAANAPF